MNKKRVILFSILFLLAVALVLVALLVPEVHIIGKDDMRVVVYDKTVNLVQYLQDAPFLTTAASDVYFSATGPIWMATSSILINLILAVGGTVMALACLVEIALCAVNGVAAKDNLLAKRLSIVVGAIAMFVGAYSIASYIVTTMLSNNYVGFGFSAAPIAMCAVGLVVIVLACLTGKREPNQKPSKLKSSVGYALCAILSLMGALVLFFPQFVSVFLELPNGAHTSIFDISRQAGELATFENIKDMIGDIPFGVAQYVVFAICGVCAVVFVCSLVGLILTLCNKNTNWLSARVKRWSMVLIVVYTLLYILVFCQVVVLHSTLYYPAENLLLPTKIFFALMFVPYLPYVFSTEIAYNKKPKEQKVAEQQAPKAEQPEA